MDKTRIEAEVDSLIRGTKANGLGLSISRDGTVTVTKSDGRYAIMTVSEALSRYGAK